MKEEPALSLIIPAYNEEKYIGACLESAIKNSGGKFREIIVVDNQSSDRTSEIAKSFPEVRVVKEEKKGVMRARQRGYQEASGNILAYIDADTKVPEGWVENVIDKFKGNSGLACLSGPYIYYDIPRWQKILVKFYWYFLALPLYFVVRYMVVAGNFAIKKDVLDKMGGFDTNIEFYGDDTDIARRASKFGKVKFSPGFVMSTSGRRLSGQGLIKTFLLYGSNFFSEVVAHRPLTKKYTDIR